MPQAEKELKKLEKNVAEKIDEKLKELVSGALNMDIKKLTTETNDTYRLRLGEYRIIFEAKRHIITIVIIKVAHRKEVYRDY
jgi:mRNA interferase RelE/StbE